MKGKQGSQSETLKGCSKMHTKCWKNWAVGAVVLIMVIMLAGCPQKRTSQPPTLPTTKQQTIKIGAVLPLTGDLATYGQNARDGIELAKEEVNSKGGIKVEVVYEDSKGQPQAAVSAMQKLITVDKVSCIIGEVASSPTLAMAPIANQRKVVLLSPAASSPKITNAGEYVFRIWPSDDFEVSVMADYVNRKGYKRVAVLYVNNDYGKAMYEAFARKVKGYGVAVVAVEPFQQNATDLRTQLTKIKAAQPDAIYLISYPKETIVFLGQYRQLGLKVPVLSTSAFEDPQILKTQKAAAEGVVFTSPIPPDPKDQVVMAFRKNYKAKFGKEPGLVADYGYDALKLIVEAARLGGGTDGERIKRGLEKIKDFKGASGLINFDANGDVVKPSGLKTVKGGQFVWLYKGTQR
jgi:branched-chain amino acid transport system substrate-binding protein